MHSIKDDESKSYNIWCKQAKIELLKTSRNNMSMRIQSIINIVQRALPQSKYKLFIINDENINELFKNVKQQISNWNGVNIYSNKDVNIKQKHSFREYYQTSINWFNRNKAKFYGNSLFYPVIFVHILNFVNNNNLLDNNEKLSIFTEILIKLLSSKIRFDRTKEQPLIPFQTLIQSNKFKSILLQFINHFNVNIQIEDNTNFYKKDKNRADKTWKLFKNALDEIRKLLISATLKSKEFTLFKEKIFTSKLINYSISSYQTHKHSVKESKDNKHKHKRKSMQAQLRERRIKSMNRHRLYQNQHSRYHDHRIRSPQRMSRKVRNRKITNMSLISNTTNTSKTTRIHGNYPNYGNNKQYSPSPSISHDSFDSNHYSLCNYNTNNNKNALYSIFIPFNDNLFVKYQFVSFSPLQIQKSIVHK